MIEVYGVYGCAKSIAKSAMEILEEQQQMGNKELKAIRNAIVYSSLSCRTPPICYSQHVSQLCLVCLGHSVYVCTQILKITGHRHAASFHSQRATKWDLLIAEATFLNCKCITQNPLHQLGLNPLQTPNENGLSGI
ncbi:Uncharacterized protein Fot_06679 [Forsythia ovata]|uniref:Uncharacterized protein n=1 Tax=Forsythia ovata TaxID=205694 RepID=A0ABD1WUB8_9LAMI